MRLVSVTSSDSDLSSVYVAVPAVLIHTSLAGLDQNCLGGRTELLGILWRSILLAKTPPPQPGNVSTWRWDGTRWVPVAASVGTGAGTVDQTKVVFWTPRPPWRWDGRQWTFNVRDLSRIAAATTVMPTSLPATPPPPEEPGDGNFYWDGKTWLPIVRSELAVIRFGSAAAIARDLPMGAALARIPKWLIPLLPLIVGVVGWAFG